MKSSPCQRTKSFRPHLTTNSARWSSSRLTKKTICRTSTLFQWPSTPCLANRVTPLSSLKTINYWAQFQRYQSWTLVSFSTRSNSSRRTSRRTTLWRSQTSMKLRLGTNRQPIRRWWLTRVAQVWWQVMRRKSQTTEVLQPDTPLQRSQPISQLMPKELCL